MNLKRCVNGHYYDSDKYGECPRCGSRDASSPKTVGNPKKMEETAKTPQPVSQPKKWLVGWLVCIKGQLEGNIYELKKGRTTIGGTDGQDINLAVDAQVARSCQAVIEYDPETKRFLASAGNSRELSYVNGEMVLFDLELHNRDILQVGEESFLFIPLCGEDFAWEAEEGSQES